MYENHLSYTEAVSEMYDKYISTPHSPQKKNDFQRKRPASEKEKKATLPISNIKEISSIEKALEDLEDLNSYTERKLRDYLNKRHIPRSIAIFRKFNIHFYFSKKDKHKNNVYIKFNQNFIITFSIVSKKFKGIRGQNELIFLNMSENNPRTYCFEGWADALSYMHEIIDTYNEVDSKEKEKIKFPNVIILNSVANVNKLKKLIEETHQNYIKHLEDNGFDSNEKIPMFALCFDNDQAGNDATEELKKLQDKYGHQNPILVTDMRYELLRPIDGFEFKDFNEVYCYQKENEKQ
ncbi:hypothetical protein AN643_04090 [Candidatus Epulonipiscioides saccharophilum]|nr:hypothetical protein AN643_04090 [Epulopiscium sp. SCG-B10WGA-EpuloB]